MKAQPYSREFCEPQYNQRLNVPDRPAVMERRLALSERVRRELRSVPDLPYGDTKKERLDIYQPPGTSRPVMIFIHGGYWQRYDKSEVAFLAAPFVKAGIMLVSINYNLCPAVTLDKIVAETRAACGWVWRHIEAYGGDRDRIHVCGNSAGGHLTAMMMATEWPALAPDLPRNLLKGGIAISGIYDLEPLLHTSINDAVRLDADTARRNSPVYLRPATDAPLVIAVGALESPEFQRQARLLADTWKTVSSPPLVVGERHHFNILLGMTEPGDTLMEAALAMVR